MTILTLSRFPEIFERFAASVEKHEPAARRILITSGEENFHRPGWEIYHGPEPFNFARNLNMGLRFAAPDDVLASNDDVELVEPITDVLAASCCERTAIITPQVIGDGINHPAARASVKIDSPSIETLQVIPFVCVYLRRPVIDALGPLDEGFVGYAGEDEEYGLRALNRGWKLRVSGRTKVIHGFGGHKFSSTFLRVMTPAERNETMLRNRKRALQMARRSERDN